MSTTAFIRQLRDRFGPIIVYVYHGLALIGAGAIVALATQAGRLIPDGASTRTAVFGTIRYDGAQANPDDSEGARNRAIANYLSRKYRVASDVTGQLVNEAFDAGRRVDLDPLLILAVAAIESRFNPIAESVMGARGLMQVIPRHHRDKLEEHGGAESVLDPSTNIQLGARILKEYIRRAGSLEAGLQLYAGAFSDGAGQYSQKVVAERERLRQAARRGERPVVRDTTT